MQHQHPELPQSQSSSSTPPRGSEPPARTLPPGNPATMQQHPPGGTGYTNQRSPPMGHHLQQPQRAPPLSASQMVVGAPPPGGAHQHSQGVSGVMGNEQQTEQQRHPRPPYLNPSATSGIPGGVYDAATPARAPGVGPQPMMDANRHMPYLPAARRNPVPPGGAPGMPTAGGFPPQTAAARQPISAQRHPVMPNAAANRQMVPTGSVSNKPTTGGVMYGGGPGMAGKPGGGGGAANGFSGRSFVGGDVKSGGDGHAGGQPGGRPAMGGGGTKDIGSPSLHSSGGYGQRLAGSGHPGQFGQVGVNGSGRSVVGQNHHPNSGHIQRRQYSGGDGVDGGGGKVSSGCDSGEIEFLLGTSDEMNPTFPAPASSLHVTPPRISSASILAIAELDKLLTAQVKATRMRDTSSGAESASGPDGSATHAADRSADGGGAASLFRSNAAEVIAAAVEFRLRQTILEAKKLRDHSLSRWSTGGALTCQDVRNALRILNIEPLWGHEQKKAAPPSAPGSANGVAVLHASFGHNAAALAAAPAAVPSSPTGPPQAAETDPGGRADESSAPTVERSAAVMRLLGKSAASIINMRDFAFSTVRLPRIPRYPLLSVSWMAVDGAEADTTDTVSKERLNSRQPVGVAGDVRPASLYKTTGPPSGDFVFGSDSKPGDRGDELSEIIFPYRLEHRLSREHFVYLSQVRSAIRAALRNPKERAHDKSVSNVLRSLQVDTSSAQLVPYLTHFAACEAKKVIKKPTDSPRGLKVLIRFLAALIQNPQLRLHNYAHQLLHPLLSVVLDPNLAGGCSTGATGQPALSLVELSQLRRHAAQAVAYMVYKLKNFPPVLISRIANFYLRCLHNFVAPLQSTLGAVLGIRALGGHAVRMLLFPVLPLLVASLEATEEFEMLKFALQGRGAAGAEQPNGGNGGGDEKRALALRFQLRTMLLRELLGAVGDGLDPTSAERHPELLLPGESFAVGSGLDQNFHAALIKLSNFADEKHLPQMVAALHRAWNSRRPVLSAGDWEDFEPDIPEMERPLADASQEPDLSRKRTRIIEDVVSSVKRMRRGSGPEAPPSNNNSSSDTFVSSGPDALNVII